MPEDAAHTGSVHSDVVLAHRTVRLPGEWRKQTWTGSAFLRHEFSGWAALSADTAH
jgi:hypothetical protein